MLGGKFQVHVRFSGVSWCFFWDVWTRALIQSSSVPRSAGVPFSRLLFDLVEVSRYVCWEGARRCHDTVRPGLLSDVATMHGSPTVPEARGVPGAAQTEHVLSSATLLFSIQNVACICRRSPTLAQTRHGINNPLHVRHLLEGSP